MSQVSTQAADSVSIAELLEQLTQFDGPPDQFLLHLLSVQCQIVSAESGAMLRLDAEGRGEVLSVWPEIAKGGTAPVWLAQAAESAQRVAREAINLTVPLRRSDEMYQERPSHYLVLLPLLGGQGVRGVAAFHLGESDRTKVHHATQQLELTVSMLSLYEMRLSLQQRGTDLSRLRQSMEVLAAINQTKRFKAMAMAFCNQIAAHWQADRVSLGILEGRYVKVRGTSHTEKFTRKMKLVLDIESAMEECFDQDVEVLHPPAAQATYVSRAAGELAGKHGPNNVVSLPLRQEQKVIGVLTVERTADKPFDLEQIESLRLVCELCTARVSDLHEHDKWVGAKAAGGCRKALTTVVGPEHTWLKVLLVAIFAAAVFFTFARGNDYAEGSFLVEAEQRRIIPAMFAGFLEDVKVQPNDPVEKGDTLAVLDTSELREQLRKARADLAGLKTQWRAFWRPSNRAEKMMAEARIRAVKAEVQLLDQKIDQATIVSPIDGTVTQGDWMRERGRPFQVGDVLFEVAPLGKLRADILIPESRIGDLFRLYDQDQDLFGQLSPVSHAGDYLPVKVVRINPVAEVVNQRNVFRVRVEFHKLTVEQWEEVLVYLKPGAEGVGRIKVGRAHFAWLWTRDLVNWVRMKLWW